MADEHKKLTDGLMKAISAERDGYSFYMMAAGSTDDEKGKEVFETLAREELDHMNFLRQQYDAILKTGKPDSSLSLGPRKDLTGISPIFSDKLKSRIKDAHIEMSALSIGVQLELDAIRFYKEQAKQTSYPDVKKFYMELADWETGHYNALWEQQQQLKEDYWSAGGFSPF
jgi:rubrerythrin